MSHASQPPDGVLGWLPILGRRVCERLLDQRGVRVDVLHLLDDRLLERVLWQAIAGAVLGPVPVSGRADVVVVEAFSPARRGADVGSAAPSAPDHARQQVLRWMRPT